MAIQPASPEHAPESAKAPNQNLDRALLRARKAIRGTVYKADTNDAPGQRYTYVSHEQIIIAARAVLLDHDLLLEQRGCAFLGELIYETRTGRKIVWRWLAEFTVRHVESGEERQLAFEGTTLAGDKTAYAASTSIDKQAHMRLLQLAGTEEQNVEHPSHDRREQHDAPHPADEAPRGSPSRADRTNDPPSNVRRLPEADSRRQHPATDAAVELFGPKLSRLSTAAELRDWWADVARSRYERPVMETLWRMFARQARGHGFDPARLIGEKGGQP